MYKKGVIKMLINNEWKKYNKELREYRGYTEKQWEKLDYDLKMLIAHRKHISGPGSALFKHIINVLSKFEKRLRKLELLRKEETNE